MRQKPMRKIFQDNTLSVKMSLEVKVQENNGDPIFPNQFDVEGLVFQKFLYSGQSLLKIKKTIFCGSCSSCQKLCNHYENKYTILIKSECNKNLQKCYTFLELSILKKGSKTSNRQIKRSYCFLLLSAPNNSLSTDTIVGSSWMLLSVLNKYFKQTIYCF